MSPWMPELVLKKKIKFAQESYLGVGGAAGRGGWSRLWPVVGAECWFEAVCRLLHSGSWFRRESFCAFADAVKALKRAGLNVGASAVWAHIEHMLMGLQRTSRTKNGPNSVLLSPFRIRWQRGHHKIYFQNKVQQYWESGRTLVRIT